MGHDVVQERVGRASDISDINRVQINSCPFVSFHMIPYNSHTQVAARGPFVARGVSINGPRAVLKSFF